MKFVYFIQCGDDGPIKIGVASDLDKRLAGLQTANHQELFLLGFIPTADAEEMEEFLHVQFDEARVRGEWFEPSRRLLDYIAGTADKVLADRQAA